MKILFVTLQAVMILLLSAGPLLAQGESEEDVVIDSNSFQKQSDPDSTYPAAGHDFLDIFETLTRASYARLLPSGETEIKEKLLPPATLKDSEEKPLETETHAVGVSMKDPPDIGETINQEIEASLENRGTEISREFPVTGSVAWRKKPIGQRALELARMESDKEILEILHKEYGKEQLDQWLGLSRESKY
jgi:hypothetical protein